jgi:hypothetical protein
LNGAIAVFGLVGLFGLFGLFREGTRPLLPLASEIGLGPENPWRKMTVFCTGAVGASGSASAACLAADMIWRVNEFLTSCRGFPKTEFGDAAIGELGCVDLSHAAAVRSSLLKRYLLDSRHAHSLESKMDIAKRTEEVALRNTFHPSRRVSIGSWEDPDPMFPVPERVHVSAKALQSSHPLAGWWYAKYGHEYSIVSSPTYLILRASHPGGHRDLQWKMCCSTHPKICLPILPVHNTVA